MALEFAAWRSGLAQKPASAEMECAQRALIAVRIFDYAAWAYLGDTDVNIDIGEKEPFDAKTDADGYITLRYDGDGDLPEEDVTAVCKASKYDGVEDISEATLEETLFDGRIRLFSLEIGVSGEFKLTLDLKAERPWTSDTNTAATHVGFLGAKADVDWHADETDITKYVTFEDNDAYSSWEKDDFPCSTDITITGPVPGSKLCAIWVKVGDGDFTRATADGVQVGGVTFTSTDADSKVVLRVTTAGTAVAVVIAHQFKKVFIAGEGTSFDYAAGLAELHQSAAPGGNGILWVYASQYDVTPVGNLSQDHRLAVNPANGNAKRGDQRARVQADLLLNLFVYKGPATDEAGNLGRFDVTDSTHWDGLGNTHGTFDATIFNNPHPGYGMHAAVVFGLVADATKYGRYISVHSIGYTVPDVNAVDNATWTGRLQRITNKRFDIQRAWIRGGAPTTYRNRPSATFRFWDRDGRTGLISINDAFKYSNNSNIGADPQQTDDYYGGSREFGADWTTHYKAKVGTTGLHAHVIRSYRRYAPSVLLVGGKVLINGSASYADDLGASVKKIDGGVLAAAMIDDGLWSDNLYFAYYPTNFTSSRFHPSQFTDGWEVKREPSLVNAEQYSWTKT